MQDSKNTRNLHYPIRPFRLSDDVLKKLRDNKPLELSWNLYFKQIIEFWASKEDSNQLTVN